MCTCAYVDVCMYIHMYSCVDVYIIICVATRDIMMSNFPCHMSRKNMSQYVVCHNIDFV